MSSNLFSTREPPSLQGFKYQIWLLKLGPGIPLQSQEGKGKGRSMYSFSINHQINPTGILQLWMESKRRLLFVFKSTKAKSIILNKGSGRLTDGRQIYKEQYKILDQRSFLFHSLLSVNSTFRNLAWILCSIHFTLFVIYLKVPCSENFT